ncbi:MAG: hypothetical protein U0L09_09170 [Christensenellales bacterium]|nr:hypothetical protein [Christensenellales bacterium]
MENQFTREDMEKNKLMAALGYVVFFIPLLACRESKLGRYCANQGLLLAILMVLVSLLGNIFAIIPFIGWMFKLAAGLMGFVMLCGGLLCFAQLMTNERVIELPIIGFFRLLP